MIDRELSLSKPQMDFLAIDTKFGLFRGGLGSGKTHAGAAHVIHMVLKYPKALGLITAPSYKQLNDATLPTLFRLLEELGIPFRYLGGAKAQLKIGNTIVHCRSVKNYEDLRGPEYGWCYADEASLYKWEAIQVIIGRLRDKHGPRTLRCTTTPRGFNWMHDFFEENKDETKQTVTATSMDNRHLPDDYIRTLEAQYDDKFLAQERDGEYINIFAGQVYHAFDRDKHVREFDRKIFRHTTRRIGCDFNVSPITAVQGWIHGNKIFIGGETWKKDSNTYELADMLYEQFGTHKTTLHPDSTGKGRKTSAVSTDHQILKDKGFILKIKTNPAVKDRYNCINGLLAHNRLIIHPSCKKLIADLEKFTHDNTDDMLSHMSDCLGYLAWYHFPLRDMYKKSRTINI
jgi:phage terminase large subunit